MANNINAYDTTLKQASGSNDYVTATAVTGDKRALDVNVAAGSISLGTVAQDFGVSSLALRVAAQLGNASGAAAFGAGASSSQTLRVVLPTDQTSIPVTQSGTWNLNNISGTISLPTGAATSGNQATQITALQLIDDLVLAQNSVTSGQVGVLAQGATTSAAPSYSDGRTNPLSLTLAGDLRTYDEQNHKQSILNGNTLSSIDGQLFSINASTSNLNTMTTAFVSNNAFATGRGVPIMAEWDDTSTDLPSADDRLYMLRMTQYRALHSNPRNNSGLELFTLTTPGVVAFKDFPFGTAAIPDTFNSGGVVYQLNLVPDAGLNFLDYNPDGSMNCRTGSPDGTLANAVYLATDSNRNLQVVGSVAHDAADSGAPVKIGGKAASLTAEPTAVSATGDRVDLYVDTKGYTYTKDNAFRSSITQVFSSQVFNNTTTTANSSSFDCTRFRYLVVYITASKSGSPTDIRLRAQFDRGSGNWFDWYVNQWVDLRYVAGQMTFSEVVPIDQVVGTTFRVRADATGTTAVNTITLSVWVEGIT